MIENSTMASSNDGIASRRLPAADDAVLRRAALPGQPSMPLEAEPSSSPAEPFPRLSMSTPTRLLLGSVSSGIVGFTLGAMQGGQTAQLRFRAEHAHKMPDTTTGWYFYHKSKNYHAMQGGIREGFRMAARTGLWSFVALGLESTVDRYRGCSDMFSTTVATLTVAGAFSLWHRFSLSTAARTAKLGLLFGLAYGGVQDLVGLARGRPIGYVEIVRRRFGAASHNNKDEPAGRGGDDGERAGLA